MKKLCFQQMREFDVEDLLQSKPTWIDNARISEDLRGKRILVTGAAGPVGPEVVQQVLNYKPSMVILCDRAEAALYYLKLEVEERFPNIPTKMFLGDIRDFRRMHKLLSDYRPEIVLHAVSYKHAS
jgi:FlaA1/EpsC-like NDP-sugar epimerase